MNLKTEGPHERITYHHFYARKRGHPDCASSRAITPGTYSKGWKGWKRPCRVMHKNQIVQHFRPHQYQQKLICVPIAG